MKNTYERDWTAWARRVAERLCTSGYYYDPDFSEDVDGEEAILRAAHSLGPLFLLNTCTQRPVLLTQPSMCAPKWRPFDRRTSIGWHNDFSTRAGRPKLSLSWIRHEDPSGPHTGAWRVASVRSVITKLKDNEKGRALIRRLAKEAQPFGYLDAGQARLFRVVAQGGLRFYGRALREGAKLSAGRIPDFTKEVIALVEKAADAVGETLPASTGSLLIVHNWLSMHDRTEQTVTGAEARRQAWLCFVKQPHEGLLPPIDSIAIGASPTERR